MNYLVLAAHSGLPNKSEGVFTKPNGKPYTAVRGLDKACGAAELIDVVLDTEKFVVRFRTLRHAFATRLIENDIDTNGLKTRRVMNLKMFERYGHISPS